MLSSVGVFLPGQDRFESGLFLDVKSVFFTVCIGLIASILVVVVVRGYLRVGWTGPELKHSHRRG